MSNEINGIKPEDKGHNPQSPKIDGIGRFINDHIESHIYKFRHLVLIAVIGALLLSIFLFGAGLYEVGVSVYVLTFEHDVKQFIIYALKSADLFLFGMVMIIFSLGSYNLFVSRLDNIGQDSNTDTSSFPTWLQFSDFDELKILFIKVIILILSITFLEFLIQNSETLLSAELYNLLIIPVGIVLIAFSLKLIHSHK